MGRDSLGIRRSVGRHYGSLFRSGRRAALENATVAGRIARSTGRGIPTCSSFRIHCRARGLMIRKHRISQGAGNRESGRRSSACRWMPKRPVDDGRIDRGPMRAAHTFMPENRRRGERIRQPGRIGRSPQRPPRNRAARRGPPPRFEPAAPLPGRIRLRSERVVGWSDDRMIRGLQRFVRSGSVIASDRFAKVRGARPVLPFQRWPTGVGLSFRGATGPRPPTGLDGPTRTARMDIHPRGTVGRRRLLGRVRVG